MPIPSRGSTKSASNAPLPNYRGILKEMDEKNITLEMDDHREMLFRRNSKTKFFKNGDEVKSPSFNPGDQLSIEGPTDPQGYLTAVNVYWEKAASKAPATSSAGNGSAGNNNKDQSGGVDAWKDEPKKDTSAASLPATVTASAPPDDPDRPKLVRGKPADPSREHSAPVPDTPSAVPPGSTPPPITEASADAPPPLPTGGNPSVLRRNDDAAPVLRPSGDPLIDKAVEAALDFTESLPNYVCQEMMARYESSTRPANWQPMDVVTVAVVYDQGKEDYRDVTINGKPVKKGLEQIDGSWSTGEFGTMLIDLLSPATAAQFRSRGTERTSGVTTKVYDYTVQRENSHWQITMGSQTYRPPYRGSIWVDPSNGRVLRIEMQAYGFPEDFPTDHVESAMDYQYTRLGDAQQYLLPVHAETLSCQRGSDLCSHNVIDFRNYHKYSGESTITFGDTKK